MKKIIVIMSVIMITGFTHAYADKIKNVNQQAENSFKSDFAKAENVSWQQQAEYTKATFTLDKEVMFAYYSNEDGRLIAVGRNILSDRLPFSLMNDLKRNCNNYWISNLFEITIEGQASYYVTLESANETVVLKSAGSNEWSVFSKEKR